MERNLNASEVWIVSPDGTKTPMPGVSGVFQGGPVGEPWHFEPRGRLRDRILRRNANRQRSMRILGEATRGRTLWAGDRPISASFDMKLTPEGASFFRYLAGLAGARDAIDERLLHSPVLDVRGTARAGRAIGQTLQLDSGYRPASDRERRFAEANLAYRNLALRPLVEWPGVFRVVEAPAAEPPSEG